MDELYDAGTRNSEELEREQMFDWVKRLVKEGAEAVTQKQNAIVAINQAVQVMLLDVGTLRHKLKELGLTFDQVVSRARYDNTIELTVVLGDSAFRELYTKGGFTLEPYDHKATVKVEVTKKTKLSIQAENLEREKFSNPPTPSISDDLPF